MSSSKLTALREPFKLALSMVLFYWLALWMDWDLPKYGGLAIVLVSLGTAGASLQKGVLRMVGTTVGLAIGLLGVALFAQDRWGTLLFLGSYLVLVGYFMPASRYGYAWFVAGFLASLVWSTTYGDVDSAFDYAVFRYLETSSGIIIYTLVSLLVWPRHAGDQLARQGTALWSDLRTLLGLVRRELEEGTARNEASELGSRLVGEMSQMATTLQAAYADTPSVIARKRAWEVLRVNVRALGDTLVLWRESIEDGRRLDVRRRLPRLGPALDTLDRRLARIGELWETRLADDDVADADDGDGDGDATLLEPLRPEVDAAADAALPPFDRAALLGFLQQLERLDLASRELLRTMRVLAGLDPLDALDDRALPPDLFRPSPWDPARLVNATFPALCFALAYAFWIVVDPPTGPGVPNLAATIALVLLLTPMSALALMRVLFLSICVAVAPVYFFVMPRLETGLGLLTLIFIFSFVAGVLGGRSPMLKMGPLIMFVMTTGISNHQVYSFTGLVDAALMVLLAIGIVGVVQTLVTPVRPEEILLRSVRRFFRGCARVLGEFAVHRPESLARGRAVRKRYLESMILPVPRRLQGVEKKLDYTRFPDNSREKVTGLLEALQSVALRLQALDLAQDRLARHSAEWSETLVRLGRELRERLQRLFETWSRLERTDELDIRAAVQDLAGRLEAELDASVQPSHAERLDDEALTDLYALLGCIRGLIQAVEETQSVVKRIDWDQWAEARF